MVNHPFFTWTNNPDAPEPEPEPDPVIAVADTNRRNLIFFAWGGAARLLRWSWA